jgi:hypothetical protein
MAHPLGELVGEHPRLHPAQVVLPQELGYFGALAFTVGGHEHEPDVRVLLAQRAPQLHLVPARLAIERPHDEQVRPAGVRTLDRARTLRVEGLKLGGNREFKEENPGQNKNRAAHGSAVSESGSFRVFQNA